MTNRKYFFREKKKKKREKGKNEEETKWLWRKNVVQIVWIIYAFPFLFSSIACLKQKQGNNVWIGFLRTHISNKNFDSSIRETKKKNQWKSTSLFHWGKKPRTWQDQIRWFKTAQKIWWLESTRPCFHCTKKYISSWL